MVLVVRPLRGRTARQPTRPPTKEIKRASKRKERTTFPELKPSARMVAISRPRSATAEYMVLRAPKTDRKSTRLNSSHLVISYAVFCLKKKNNNNFQCPSDSQRTATRRGTVHS